MPLIRIANIHLPEGLLRELDARAIFTCSNRSALVAEALGMLLKTKAKGRAGESLDGVPLGMLYTVRRRLDAVERLRQERHRAGRRGLPIYEGMATLVSNLNAEGLRASRRTLYTWEKRFRAHGVRGLIDRRGMRASNGD